LAVARAARPIRLEVTEIMNEPYDESQERWGDLRGRHAVAGRLHEMETRLKQMREELAEIGRWADHPAFPDLTGHCKQIRELLAEAERGVRQARERRFHE
jgi:hypothetical protein